jgi:hypothetical protein
MTRTNNDISGGVVHALPEDLRNTLASDAEALAAWEDLTPLARNEWICWAISVKQPETRRQHVERVPRNSKRACADRAVGMAVFTARIRPSALRYSMCSTNTLKSHHK